ncbi:TIGR03619 family F420-dependent LLM class oxidoreductase [Amycolatopsis sp. PS_44_ISF1]|uniref:TIGR03619 family F420-dependent LLM class oxidoreductase n=1 Tax=Amycolatopsis sp. PS_44_ISF1 TaxID=2974917 RepID=UPI0028DFC741|nr:TIGR03619 family F420-dependent LLM class oxidoreductase [Amycolatopsis sp. PS_44_ISF1]MDT8912562.1 TIGR03619 family F420-dependent LLM class oxidoreductase [Amycolatopsis sp. PS_44_ISF1]
MEIGFGAPASGAWAGAVPLARFAERAEELGYSSLWTFQRLLVGAGQELAPVYQSVLDPVVALSFAAARTTRIRLGVAVLNLPFVSPVHLAKQAATLDLLSGGRLDLGLGVGWSAVEFAATGASTARRAARTEEYLRVLRTLWADEVSEFAGEFYTVPPSRMRPRPVQTPGPPVLLGGGVPAAVARAGRIADGWLSASGEDLTKIAGQIETARRAAAEAGKDPSALRFVCRGAVRVGAERPGPDGHRRRLTGSYEQIRQDAAWLGEQGVTELFYDLNWDPLIGNPAADPAAAIARAEEIQSELAPGRG